MSETCEVSGAECYVFPTYGLVIYKSTTSGKNYLDTVISKMNNGLYRYDGNFNVEHW